MSPTRTTFGNTPVRQQQTIIDHIRIKRHTVADQPVAFLSVMMVAICKLKD
jgi:hypothetical protein